MQLDRAIDLFLSAKRAEGRASNTVSSYSYALYRFARDSPVGEVDELDVLSLRGYASMLMQQQEMGALSPATVANWMRHLRAFCSWLVGEELLNKSPFEKRRDGKSGVVVPRNPEMHFDVITDDEVRALLATCDTRTNMGRRSMALFMFLFDTGVRISELTGLRVVDLDIGNRQARVYGKGSKWRAVFFSPLTALAVQRYLMHRTTESPFVFAGAGGQNSNPGLQTNAVRTLLLRHCKKAGIRHLNPHLFRHTFATNYLRNGGDSATLQRIMGHSDVSTTIRNYAHLANDDLSRAHDQYSSMARVLGRR